MQDYYRINVSKNGRYLFATEQGRLQVEEEARPVYELFKEKFPEEEGYNVTCTVWRSYGREWDFTGNVNSTFKH